MKPQTIEDLSQLWKTDKQNFVRLSSYTTYLILLERHILPEFGDKTDITEDEAQRFVLRMLAGGLSPGTVKERVLKMVLPTADVIRLLDSIRRRPCCKSLGIFIGLHTGMRIGEICALQWGDIDMRSGLIHVRRTFERIWRSDLQPPRCDLVLGPPKTASSYRDVPISEELKGLLRQFRDRSAQTFVLIDAQRPVGAPQLPELLCGGPFPDGRTDSGWSLRRRGRAGG